MALYRKKPVVIEAKQYTGTPDNTAGLIDWSAGDVSLYDIHTLLITTLEGPMRASVGDYIIRGVHGEFYACKPDVFAKTYEIVDDVLDVLEAIEQYEHLGVSPESILAELEL